MVLEKFSSIFHLQNKLIVQTIQNLPEDDLKTTFLQSLFNCSDYSELSCTKLHMTWTVLKHKYLIYNPVECDI